MTGNETELVRRAKAGDMSASEQLVRQHEGYLRMAAVRWCGRSNRYEVDDCFQQAVIGLIWAVPKFNPNHGTNFLTYAAWWVRKSLSELRLTRTVIRITAEKKTDRNQDDRRRAASIQTLRSNIPSRDLRQYSDTVDLRDLLSCSMRRLTERQRSVMAHRLQGETQEAVAKSLKVSRQAVVEHEQKAIASITTELLCLHRRDATRQRVISFDAILPPPPCFDVEFMPLLEVVTPKNLEVA